MVANLHHHNQQQHLAGLPLTDDEDEDDFNNDNQFYDSLNDLPGQHASRLSAGQLSNGQQANQPDPNGLLIDKNKKLFPQKLWELIHNPSIQHCLRWSQDGQRVYLNRNEFETYYLKTPNNQFHTQKAISFVRQMNMYGFRKVDDCYYENDNFRRDRQHLLKNMIRRHPNKGLFVGLDHHQLAAAAAAQQALQVNQQLQQLEHQHKHRAEQALRLNSYLNSHHQFHSSALAHHHHHHQHHQQQQQQQHHHNHHSHHHHHLKHSSVTLEQMSSQLAQAAVSHLSQQQQHQLALHAQLGGPENMAINSSAVAAAAAAAAALASNQLDHNHLQKVHNATKEASRNGAPSPLGQHQPKKSRLLNNFYASVATNNNNNSSSSSNNNNSVDNNNIKNDLSANSLAAVFAADARLKQLHHPAGQLIGHNQDSMHSTSSVDTQPSQCSSVLNSGSAGSPQPNSPAANHQDHHQNRRNGGAGNNNRAAKEAHQNGSDKFNNSNGAHRANQATDLSSHSLAAAAHQAALHQTLVRSLLQLKQHNQQPQDLLASLKQQHSSRSLLESLASLSSAGTGSIVDPTSNSPTERTATPPTEPDSPIGLLRCNDQYGDPQENMALDLAPKSSSSNTSRQNLRRRSSNGSNDRDREEEDEEDCAIDIEGLKEREPEEKGGPIGEDGVSGVDSPLDGPKRVKRFLEDQIASKEAKTIKREDSHYDDEDLEEGLSHRKRLRTANSNSSDSGSSVESFTRSLINEICDRRGDQLNEPALSEAVRYTECFLETLLDDASLIAGHSDEEREQERDKVMEDVDTNENGADGDERKASDSSKNKSKLIDASSLSLALNLIPSKLLDAIQQQGASVRSITSSSASSIAN